MTDTTTGQQIIAGMRDAVAHARGDESAATVRTVSRSDVLRALADRVEAGAVCGVDLTGEIARALGWTVDRSGSWINPRGRLARLPNWLGSLDATEALRQAVLPGWTLAVRPESDGLIRAELGRGHEWGDPFVEPHMGRSATEPAARLSALLRALAAEMEARPC